jgi:hypothetical protein
MKNELIELATDLGEVALDTQIAEGIVQEIPILGSFVKLARAAASVPDKIFARKVDRFLTAFEPCTDEQVQGFRERLEANPGESQKAGEAALHSINAADDDEKAKIVGILFRHYLSAAVALDELRQMLSAINRAFVEDLRDLVRVERGKRMRKGFGNRFNLIGTDLVETFQDQGGTLINVAGSVRMYPSVVVTQLGTRFVELLCEWDEQSDV